MKKTKDYDSVAKTMKLKHKRLFIPVINDKFGKNYSLDTPVEVLSAEGYLTEDETGLDEKEIKERLTDFLVRIKGEVYLLKFQSYDDGSMAIRLAEYAFITARKNAIWRNGDAVLPLPHFAVIYIKRTPDTPKYTRIRFTLPDGQSMMYEAENIFLDVFSKEYIIEKRLYPYIPFYIARYEKELSKEGDVSQAEADLQYFRDELLKLHEQGELSDIEIKDLVGFVNTIITHITDGNRLEKRMVTIMGGVILETESERLIRIGRDEGISIGEKRGEKRGEEKGIASLIETCQELNLSFDATKQKLMSKFALKEKKAFEKMEKYWK